MAGHIIADYFLNIGNYKIITLEESSIFNGGLLSTSKDFLINNVDIVINCIRCLVEESEENIEKAEMYNYQFPKYIEKYYRDTKTKIIHLSTDCIFSGNEGNYNEQAKPNGISIYSKTKALGEINNNKDVTIRTSYIGPNIGESEEELFHWFMVQKNKTISGYSNAYWNGVTTLELAKSLHKIIEKNITGLYHLVPNGKLSKYELLALIKEIWKKKDIILKIDSSIEYNRTLLDTRKLVKVSNFNKMLKELFDYMLIRKYIYSSYF
jgi:dTDP-4-dehydrorhamnose reductase